MLIDVAKPCTLASLLPLKTSHSDGVSPLAVLSHGTRLDRCRIIETGRTGKGLIGAGRADPVAVAEAGGFTGAQAARLIATRAIAAIQRRG